MAAPQPPTTLQTRTRTTPRRRRASDPEDWHRSKDDILAWIAADCTHADVLENLAATNPDFRPTLSMLKRQLRQWGVGRNHREADIIQALRIAFERHDLRQKRSAFRIRKRPVNTVDIARYLARKNVANLRAFVDRSTKGGDSAHIEVYTPPATPSPRVSRRRKGRGNANNPSPRLLEEFLTNDVRNSPHSFQDQLTNETILMLSRGTDQVPKGTSDCYIVTPPMVCGSNEEHLTLQEPFSNKTSSSDGCTPVQSALSEAEAAVQLPQEDAVLHTSTVDNIDKIMDGIICQLLTSVPPVMSFTDAENALMANDVYHRFIFADADREKPSMAGSQESKLIDAFTSGMWRGRDHLIESSDAEAFECFDQGFRTIPYILYYTSRRFLPELFEMLLNFQLEDHFDILRQLLAFIIRKCHADNGMSSFVAQILESLLRLGRIERLDTVAHLMRNVLDHFTVQLGSDHLETRSIHKALVRSTVRCKPLVNAIISFEAICVAHHERKASLQALYEHCNFVVELALHHRAHNDLSQAEVWSRKAMKASLQIASPFYASDVQVRCLRILSYTERRQERWLGAYRLARNAVAVASQGLGEQDSLTALVKEELFIMKRQAGFRQALREHANHSSHRD